MDKARLVAKRFTQIQGIDYEDTFSPTLHMSTFRMILSQAVQLGLHLVHMDVVTVFYIGACLRNYTLGFHPTCKIHRNLVVFLN